MHKHTYFDEFIVGCNYFASHKGIHMWKFWDEDIVDKDFEVLKKHGIEYIRIFPVWSDFQPLTPHTTENGLREVRFGEEPFPDTPAGRAGVDQYMADRLVRTIELAQKHDIKVMIELVNRWISGRNFTPPMFWDKDYMSDPTVLKWQIRMIRYLVNLCKSFDNVIAWGLGNENNCGSNCSSRDEAWLWTATISSVVKSCDPNRPVVSGMHALNVAPHGNNHWFFVDQGENNDILTIHPYPYYTAHCNRDRLTSLRSILHSEAESVLTSDIGGKPCLTQELGVLGPMFGNDEMSGSYVSSVLWSVWTCGDIGVYWWMAFDSDTYETPYDWNATERELGFMDVNRNPRAIVFAMKSFRDNIRSLPKEYQKISKRKSDVVCILSYYQDSWTVAYSSYILSKQAGFDIQFTDYDSTLPISDFYMLPSIKGINSISKRKWDELLKRVEEGATLYISSSNAFISSFTEITGLEISERAIRTGNIIIPTENGTISFPAMRDGGDEAYKFDLINKNSEILLTEDDGTPFLVSNKYGKGKIFTMFAGIEFISSNMNGSFEDKINDFSFFYRLIFEDALKNKFILKNKNYQDIALSEHVIDTNTSALVIINHAKNDFQGEFTINKPYKSIEILCGNGKIDKQTLSASIKPNEACVISIKL